VRRCGAVRRFWVASKMIWWGSIWKLYIGIYDYIISHNNSHNNNMIWWFWYIYISYYYYDYYCLFFIIYIFF
jgi:hypothetical protein